MSIRSSQFFHRLFFAMLSIARLGMLPASGAENTVSFSRQIAPIFAKQCQTCHGPEKAKGRYRLDTFERLSKPGSSDLAPVFGGHPQQSEIYNRLIRDDEDERMPQKADPLPNAQIELIRRWIEQGARFDGPDPAAPLSSLSPAPTQPAPPKVYPAPVPIAALALSPDGKVLAASGYHEVTLWDPRSGVLIGRIADMPERILGLCYSSDGKFLAVAGGTPGSQGEVRLVDLASNSSVKLLERIADVMTVVRFSPDGAKLAAGGSDNAIRIYDVASGRRERLIEQHADWITDLSYSPDGSRIASASRDKSSRLFTANTGAMEAAYVDSEEPLYAVAWSEDGKHIFTSGRDHKIHIWTPGDSKKALEIATGAADAFHLQATEGLLLTAASDGAVRCYGQSDRKLVRTFGTFSDWASGLAVNASANLVAAGSYDGRVRVWDMKEGTLLSDFIAEPGLEKVGRTNSSTQGASDMQSR